MQQGQSNRSAHVVQRPKLCDILRVRLGTLFGIPHVIAGNLRGQLSAVSAGLERKVTKSNIALSTEVERRHDKHKVKLYAEGSERF